MRMRWRCDAPARQVGPKRHPLSLLFTALLINCKSSKSLPHRPVIYLSQISSDTRTCAWLSTLNTSTLVFTVETQFISRRFRKKQFGLNEQLSFTDQSSVKHFHSWLFLARWIKISAVHNLSFSSADDDFNRGHVSEHFVLFNNDGTSRSNFLWNNCPSPPLKRRFFFFLK